MKISWRPNIGMWGVNPEARGWNVGAVCSDFHLDECISRKSPQRTLIWLFLQIHSPKLISEHTAPTFQPLASGLTPHMPMFGCPEILLLMGGSTFEVKIHPADSQKVLWTNLYFISYIWKATKSGSAPIFWRFQLVSPLPVHSVRVSRGRVCGSWL